MQYTIWRHGVLLGGTDLAMPSPNPDVRMGQLEPTLEFERAWAEFGPTVTEYFAAGVVVGNEMADLPPATPGATPAERARQVHDWMTAAPGAARLRTASEALAAVGLELRDSTGRHVPSESVIVQELRPPDWIPAEAIARTVAEARAAGVPLTIPSYITIVRDAGDTPEGEPPRRTPT
jgi:hypothetical protein